MDQKEFEGSVNPVDFHQFVCINTLAPDPEFWPKAEALIRQASAQYRIEMAMGIVENSSDFDLQKKPQNLLSAPWKLHLTPWTMLPHL